MTYLITRQGSLSATWGEVCGESDCKETTAQPLTAGTGLPGHGSGRTPTCAGCWGAVKVVVSLQMSFWLEFTHTHTHIPVCVCVCV